MPSIEIPAESLHDAYMRGKKEAADEIERLRERCEAYKGQVQAGAAEIERLRKIEEAAHRYWRAWHHENSETIELQAELLRLAVNEHAARDEQNAQERTDG